MRRTPLDFGEVSSSGEPLGPNLGGSLPSVKLQPSTILGAFKKDSADEPGPCSPRAEQKGAARPAPYSDFRVFAPPDGFDMYPAIRSHRNTLYCPATWKIEPLPRKLFHGRRYLAQTGGTSRADTRKTAFEDRGGPRGANLQPRSPLLSHRELVSGPFCHSKRTEADRSLLASTPEYRTHSRQAQRRHVQ